MSMTNYNDTSNLCYFPGPGVMAGRAVFCGAPLPCPEHGGRIGAVDGNLVAAWVRIAEKSDCEYFNLLDDMRAKEASLAEYRTEMARLARVLAAVLKLATDSMLVGGPSAQRVVMGMAAILEEADFEDGQ